MSTINDVNFFSQSINKSTISMRSKSIENNGKMVCLIFNVTNIGFDNKPNFLSNSYLSFDFFNFCINLSGYGLYIYI